VEIADFTIHYDLSGATFLEMRSEAAHALADRLAEQCIVPRLKPLEVCKESGDWCSYYKHRGEIRDEG